MAVFTGVVTDQALEKFARALAGDPGGSPMSLLNGATFKFGEGGWINPGPGKVPRVPDPTLTDVDAIARPFLYPADSRYVFTKTFPAPDVFWEAPSVARCRLFLDFGEANDDGFGNSPEFWEVGIFDTTGMMVAYFTMPVQVKTPIVQIENVGRIIFAR